MFIFGDEQRSNLSWTSTTVKPQRVGFFLPFGLFFLTPQTTRNLAIGNSVAEPFTFRTLVEFKLHPSSFETGQSERA